MRSRFCGSVLGVVFAIAFLTGAQANTLSFSSVDGPVPLFDPALGSLDRVDLDVTLSSDGSSLTLLNTTNEQQTGTLSIVFNYNAASSIATPAGSIPISSILPFTEVFPFDLPAGSQGQEFVVPSSTQDVTASFGFDEATQLALFLTSTLPNQETSCVGLCSTSLAGAGSFTGGLSGVSIQDRNFRSPVRNFDLTYTFTPSATPIPLPAGVLLLGSVIGFGAAASRFRKAPRA